MPESFVKPAISVRFFKFNACCGRFKHHFSTLIWLEENPLMPPKIYETSKKKKKNRA